MPGIKVTGVDKIVARLEKINAKIAGPAIREAISGAAEIVADAVTVRTPRRSGQLVTSISIVERKRPSRALTTQERDLQFAVMIGPSKQKGFYGYFQEYGTNKQAAKPFVRPAFDESQANARRKIQEFIVKAIEKT